MSNPAKETKRLSKFVTEPGTGREEKIRRRDATGPDFVVDSYAARTGLSQVRGAGSGFERAAIALVPGFSLSGAVQHGTAGISVCVKYLQSCSVGSRRVFVMLRRKRVIIQWTVH